MHNNENAENTTQTTEDNVDIVYIPIPGNIDADYKVRVRDGKQTTFQLRYTEIKLIA